MKINCHGALNVSEEDCALRIKKITFQNNEFLQILTQAKNSS